jgi:hypothetical protein
MVVVPGGPGAVFAGDRCLLPDAAIDEIPATRTAKPHDAGRLAFAFAQRHRVEPL